MSQTLSAPDKSAPTSDWLAWLEELEAMPATVAVRNFLREARQVLKTKRHKCHKHLHTPSPFGRHEFC